MTGNYTPSFIPPNWGANFGNPATPQVQPWDMPTGGQNLYESGVPGGVAPGVANVAPAAALDPTFLQKMMGYQSVDPTSKAVLQNPGWGGAALGAGSALVNAFMGMKQYGLYKDQLAESKRQFGLNYDAQRTTTNTALQDRQIARVASNPGAYQSVGAYMQSNGIKGG